MTQIEWAERAMSPARHFEPMQVKDGIGMVHGHVCCVANHEAVEAKRRADYEAKSRSQRRAHPIWC